MEIAKAEKRIANRVKKQVEDGQKEYYLREKMRAISKELGEDENEMLEYRKRIEDSKMPAETAKRQTRKSRDCPRWLLLRPTPRLSETM